MLGGRGREALRCRLRLFVLSTEHEEGYGIIEVATLHYLESPRVEDDVPPLSLVAKVGALKGEEPLQPRSHKGRGTHGYRGRYASGPTHVRAPVRKRD